MTNFKKQTFDNETYCKLGSWPVKVCNLKGISGSVQCNDISRPAINTAINTERRNKMR